MHTIIIPIYKKRYWNKSLSYLLKIVSVINGKVWIKIEAWMWILNSHGEFKYFRIMEAKVLDDEKKKKGQEKEIKGM